MVNLFFLFEIFYEKCEKFEKVHLYVVFGRIGLQKNHILVDHACSAVWFTIVALNLP
jgi:hypothetical protein